MFYMLWFDGDCEYNLSWFEIFTSRTKANEAGRKMAAEKGWRFKYLSAKSGEQPYEYDGKRTIVVHQTNTYYHGA